MKAKFNKSGKVITGGAAKVFVKIGIATEVKAKGRPKAEKTEPIEIIEEAKDTVTKTVKTKTAKK